MWVNVVVNRKSVTHFVDHPRSGVVYNFSPVCESVCLSVCIVCMYVCQTITLECLDYRSSFSLIRTSPGNTCQVRIWRSSGLSQSHKNQKKVENRYFRNVKFRLLQCFEKRGVEFVITSSTINRFWKLSHCWKQQWIICKINIIFLLPLNNLAVLPCET